MTINESKEREKILFLQEFSQTKIPLPTHLLTKDAALRDGIPINGREHPVLESIFLFSLIWSTKSFLLNKACLDEYNKFLKRRINIYEDSMFGRSFDFACGIRSVLEADEIHDGHPSIFNFCFDQLNEKWIYWKEVKIHDHSFISNNFDIDLRFAELVKLNPLLTEVIV